MSVLYEIISVLIGRWILGGIGFYIKKLYYFLSGTEYKRNKDKSGIDDMLDMEEFSNRIIGLLAIFGLFLIADVFFKFL